MNINKLQWDTLQCAEGECLTVDFDVRPRHIAVIPFEVLEDGLQTFNVDPLSSAVQHRNQLGEAISNALEDGGWRELVNVGTGQALFQLWITRRHFGK
jgi:hypothetical protein